MPILILSLLFLGTVALWVRSYRTTDTLFIIYKIEGSDQLRVMRGTLLIQHFRPLLGKRGRFDHLTHREERITSLPPPLWVDRPPPPWGKIFGFVNVPGPPPASQTPLQAQTAWRSLSRAAQEAVVKPQFDALVRFAPGKPVDPSFGDMINDQLIAEHDLQLEDPHASVQFFLQANGPPRFELMIPLWVICLLPFVPLLPALLRPLRRRNRRRRGHCEACGYDLRATPTRCPECGAPAPTRDCHLALEESLPQQPRAEPAVEHGRSQEQ